MPEMLKKKIWARAGTEFVADIRCPNVHPKGGFPLTRNFLRAFSCVKNLETMYERLA